jgi:hypothetical protein
MVLLLCSILIFAAAILLYIWREQTAYDQLVTQMREMESTIRVMDVSLKNYRADVERRLSTSSGHAEAAHELALLIDRRISKLDRAVQDKETSMSIRMSPVPVELLERGALLPKRRASGARSR